MRTKSQNVQVKFDCPKVGRIVELRFTKIERFGDELDVPTHTDVEAFRCEGMKECGVYKAPPFDPDLSSCVYPNLSING